MNENAVKSKVVNLEYELAATKIFESECAAGNKSNAKTESLNSMKDAFQHFFSENRPVPLRFFSEKHREAFMEALRAHRVSLIQAPINKKIVTKNLPHVAEYYVELYGTMDSIVSKVDKILEFVEKIKQDGHVDLELMDLLKNVNDKLVDDFDLLKIELGEAQRSMKSVVNELVQTHRSVAQICDHIEQETLKRYESEEKYSDDGSTIIVSNDEKYYVKQLNSKVDDFLTKKSILLKNLPILMKLAANLFDLKNEIYHKFKMHALTLTSAETVSSKHAKPKIKIKVDKTAEYEKVESHKIFKKFNRD